MPERLAELIEGILRPEPLERPDAFTVAKSLAPSLEPTEWRDYLSNARDYFYNKNDLAKAYNAYQSALLAASGADIRSTDFASGLEELSTVATDLGKLAEVAPSLMKRFCESAVALGPAFPATPARQIFSDLTKAAADANGKLTVALALDVMCEAVECNGPIVALCDAMGMIRESVRRPVFWGKRDDLYLLLEQYNRSGMLASEILLTFA